jgi:hypothetical protein
MAQRALAFAIAAAGLAAACQPTAPSPAAAPRRVEARAHRPRGPEVRCDPSRLVAPDVPTARAQCEGGVVKGCTRLLDLEAPTPATIALTERVLSAACARDRAASERSPGDETLATARTCSCGAYGAASTLDPAREVEGIVLLDEACTRGLLDACDLADLIGELCTLERRPMCDDLLAQGRVRTPGPEDDPLARAATPPASLLGCFVVASGAEGHLAAGAAICFGADRVSWRAPGEPWDQRAVEWRGWPGVGVWIAGSDRARLVASRSGVTYGRATLTAADASVTREAGALPSVHDTCGRVKRCADALEAAAGRTRRPRAGDEAEGELPPLAQIEGLPRTLRGCQAWLHGYARSGAPAACR